MQTKQSGDFRTRLHIIKSVSSLLPSHAVC